MGKMLLRKPAGRCVRAALGQLRPTEVEEAVAELPAESHLMDQV